LPTPMTAISVFRSGPAVPGIDARSVALPLMGGPPAKPIYSMQCKHRIVGLTKAKPPHCAAALFCATSG
jgi:hypothetical protein